MKAKILVTLIALALAAPAIGGTTFSSGSRSFSSSRSLSSPSRSFSSGSHTYTPSVKPSIPKPAPAYSKPASVPKPAYEPPKTFNSGGLTKKSAPAYSRPSYPMTTSVVHHHYSGPGFSSGNFWFWMWAFDRPHTTFVTAATASPTTAVPAASGPSATEQGLVVFLNIMAVLILIAAIWYGVMWYRNRY